MSRPSPRHVGGCLWAGRASRASAIFSGRTANASGLPRGADLIRSSMACGAVAVDDTTSRAQPADAAAVEDVGVADEVGDEARVRPLVDLGGVPTCTIPAVVHHGDAVAIAIASSWSCVTITKVMPSCSADPSTRTASPRAASCRARRAARRAAGAWALRERARQRHALPLAAGKLVRLALREAARACTSAQHLVDARGDLGLRQAVLLRPKATLLGDRHMRKQRVGLEHHVDRPLDSGGTPARSGRRA